MISFQGQKNIDREKSFWSKIQKGHSHECWPWIASKNCDGYGQFWIGNTFVPSHRYAWELARRCKVPEGMMVLHMCDNRACCNEAHLYCGDAQKNADDRCERTIRDPRIFASNTKLHEGEIWLIRRLKVVKSRHKVVRYKFSEAYVAKMFKVDQSLIHLIWNSDRWLSLEGTYA